MVNPRESRMKPERDRSQALIPFRDLRQHVEATVDGLNGRICAFGSNVGDRLVASMVEERSLKNL